MAESVNGKWSIIGPSGTLKIVFDVQDDDADNFEIFHIIQGMDVFIAQATDDDDTDEILNKVVEQLGESSAAYTELKYLMEEGMP